MLSWFYKWRLWGYIFVWEKLLPQSHRHKACAQSARRQRPCCRPFRRCVSSSKMNVPLTQVALVARPCAPAAQRADDSSSSSRRLAINLCRFAPLEIEQDCSFRMSRKKWNCPDEVLRTNWFLPGKTSSSKTPLRQLSKVCDCFADAWIWKAVLAPNFFFPAVAPRRHDDFQNFGGSARSGQKNFLKNLICWL